MELWKTVSNHPCYALKISNASQEDNKKCVFITCRVHPGESNASFMMEGILNQILWSHDVKSKFNYIVIPCLNPDGVYYGKYRWNMIGSDLNRVWNCPSKYFHPTIYYAKQFLKEIHSGEYFKNIENIKISGREKMSESRIIEIMERYSLPHDTFMTPKVRISKYTFR